MPISLLAFDLDGTTIIQHQFLSPGNRAALVRASEQGVSLVPATGRMLGSLPADISSLPGIEYIIASNGAVVCHVPTGKIIHRCLISNEKALAVQAILDEYDIYIEYHNKGKAITKTGYPSLARTYFHFPISKYPLIESKEYTFTDNYREMLIETALCPEKINLPYVPGEQNKEIWQRLEGLGGLLLTSSIPDNIEINAIGADKGSALIALGEYLSLPTESIMAIGDNGNDVSMLHAAGVSVAVADGAPVALAAAKYQTAPHDEDGLAQAISRFILDK